MSEILPSITLREIAQTLKLSKSAVHYALHNSPRISQATKLRVQAFAAANGYQQNPTVSKLTSELRRSRTRKQRDTLAFLHADRVFAPETIPLGWTWKQYMEGARSRAFELGYAMDVFWLGEPGFTAKRLKRILNARGISGLLVSPFSRGYGHVPLHWDGFIGVAVGHQMIRPRLHSVMANTFHAAEIALRRLKQMNYRRVGLALRPVDERFTNGSYLGAYLRWMLRQPKELQIPVFLPTQDNKWRPKEFLNWYKKYRPQVILAVSPIIHGWLLGGGIGVPEEVGIVLFDSGQSSEVSTWAGVDVQHKVIGREAVDLLVADLNANALGVPKHSRTVLIEGVWRDGVTLAGAPPT